MSFNCLFVYHNRISENGEEEENDNSEADQELQLITECWVRKTKREDIYLMLILSIKVEPQNGFVETEDDEKKDLTGCTSQEITKSVSKRFFNFSVRDLN